MIDKEWINGRIQSVEDKVTEMERNQGTIHQELLSLLQSLHAKVDDIQVHMEHQNRASHESWNKHQKGTLGCAVVS